MFEGRKQNCFDTHTIIFIPTPRVGMHTTRSLKDPLKSPLSYSVPTDPSTPQLARQGLYKHAFPSQNNTL